MLGFEAVKVSMSSTFCKMILARKTGLPIKSKHKPDFLCS